MTNTETYFDKNTDFKDRKVPWASKQKTKQKTKVTRERKSEYHRTFQ